MQTIKKTRLGIVVLLLSAIIGIGATIQWYSDQPVTTTLQDGDILVLETTGPQGYKSFTLFSLKAYIGTNGYTVQYVTNQFVSFNYTTNQFVEYSTNINQFVTNQFVEITTNLIQYVTTNYIDYSFITNLTVVEQNFITVRGGKVYVTNIYAGDATFTNGVYVVTNTWANAPTGTVDLAIMDQAFITTTDMEITGFTSRSNTVSESVVMSITNSTSANKVMYLPTSTLPERTNAFVVSNASWGVLSMRYHPAMGTNFIWKQW